MNPKVDAFLSRAGLWAEEMQKLRLIVLDCGLDEELKWGKPCYAYHGKNIVVIQGFKDYCALLFLKGYLLNDPDGILIKTGENTVVGRQVRFTNVREIVQLKTALKRYIYEAVEVEGAGLKVILPKKEGPKIPEEFQRKLNENPALNAAFNALTPGRQKAYLIYFSQPKQSGTRDSRIKKYTQHILNGIGLNDEFIAMRKRPDKL